MIIPLSRANITEDDVGRAASALRSGWLSQGEELRAFERAVAERARRRFGVAVSSGTSALHLCLLALGVTEGDEVITSPFSFIATTNAILFVRAKPVFVDIDPETYNLDPDLIDRAVTGRSKALLAVESLANVAHFEHYENAARRYGLKLIEDSAEALGARTNGRPAGSFGACSLFGFFPNKQITTGEGGIVVTDSEEIREACVSLRNHGRDATGDSYVSLGFNYKLGEVAAALGHQQMQRLDEILARRREVASAYDALLADVEDVHVPPNPCRDDPGSASWFAYVIRLADAFDQTARDRLLEGLRREGVGCGRYFPSIHLQKHIKEKFGFEGGEFPQCERISQRTVALPFFTDMREEEVGYVCEALKRCLKALR
ncbi:MAG TPA: DegT/DnrJ/EryC1/StrS family aminotransferase [Pyrinomonadaceae bacterium]